MVKLLSIFGLLLFTLTSNAQVINYVDKEYNADFNVYFTKYKYGADIIIFRTKYKYESKTRPGYWFWRDDNRKEYDNNQINVFKVKYKYQSDYIVYISKYPYEIKLTSKYIEEWTKQ